MLVIESADPPAQSTLPTADEGALYSLAHAPTSAAIRAARNLLRAALTEWDIKAHDVNSAATMAIGRLVENVVRESQAAGRSESVQICVRLVRRGGQRYIRIEIFDRMSKPDGRERSMEAKRAGGRTSLDIPTRD